MSRCFFILCRSICVKFESSRFEMNARGIALTDFLSLDCRSVGRVFDFKLVSDSFGNYIFQASGFCDLLCITNGGGFGSRFSFISWVG